MTASHAGPTAPLAHADVVVLDYLAALWAESENLSPNLRDELMSTVADYIAVRRTASADPIGDPEQIVGRLGPPEALVASVRRGRMPMHLRLPVPPPYRPPVPAGARPTGAEPAAIALLMAGAFVLPVISPLAAMVMVSGSRRWTVAQKAAGWVLAMGAILAGFVLGVLATAFTYDDGFGLVVAYLTAVAGAVIAGVTLLPGLSAPKRG
ncbi:MAG TPA: hypothetical protein VFH03_09345 [Actinoplanes sp.]|nr:hypothetical protein [Actinoplanes sp.]